MADCGQVKTTKSGSRYFMDNLKIQHLVCAILNDRDVYGRYIDERKIQFAHVTEMGLIITTAEIDFSKTEEQNAFEIAGKLLFDEEM
jgi:hypothetical protein